LLFITFSNNLAQAVGFLPAALLNHVSKIFIANKHLVCALCEKLSALCVKALNAEDVENPQSKI
jgi:hypothetical protein